MTGRDDFSMPGSHKTIAESLVYDLSRTVVVQAYSIDFSLLLICLDANCSDRILCANVYFVHFRGSECITSWKFGARNDLICLYIFEAHLEADKSANVLFLLILDALELQERFVWNDFELFVCWEYSVPFCHSVAEFEQVC